MLEYLPILFPVADFNNGTLNNSTKLKFQIAGAISVDLPELISVLRDLMFCSVLYNYIYSRTSQRPSDKGTLY